MTTFRKELPYLDNVLITSNSELEKLAGSTVLITGGYGMLLTYTTLSICLYNSLHPKSRINLILIVRDINRALIKLSSYPGFEFVHLIESDLSESININEKVDYLIHGAGYGSPKDYLNKIDLVFKSNIIGIYNLLTFAKEKEVKTFLNISSGSVYGNNFDEEFVDEFFLGEVNYNDSNNFYSETKRFSEMITKVHAFPGSVVTLRPAHIYGPTMDINNDNRIICSFIRNILNNEPLEILSDGKDKRSFCHVSDFTNGLLKALLFGTSGENYNIGNDDMYLSINELAQKVINSFPSVSIKRNNLLEARKANKMLMMSTKLKSLGWSPNIKISDGFLSTYNYYKTMLK